MFCARMLSSSSARHRDRLYVGIQIERVGKEASQLLVARPTLPTSQKESVRRILGMAVSATLRRKPNSIGDLRSAAAGFRRYAEPYHPRWFRIKGKGGRTDCLAASF